MTNSRDKGARGERALANYLKARGYKARRGQQYSGANGDADVVGLPGIHIECKWVEAVTPKLMDTYMQQSMEDANYGEIPLVVHKRNRHPWMVTMQAHDMCAMLAEDIKVRWAPQKVTLTLDDFIEVYQTWQTDRRKQ